MSPLSYFPSYFLNVNLNYFQIIYSCNIVLLKTIIVFEGLFTDSIALCEIQIICC